MTDHNDPHWHQTTNLTGSPYLLPHRGTVSDDLTFPLKMGVFGLDTQSCGTEGVEGLDLDVEDIKEEDDMSVTDDVMDAWLVSGTTPAGGMIDQELDGGYAW